jgi:hypothetical protein
MTDAATESPPLTDDPVYRHSRREAIVIFFVWLAAACWAIPFCYLNGYEPPQDPEFVRTVLGIPSWVFWGIVMPWLMADLVTIWLCFEFIQNDDLGEAHEGEDVAEDVAELHVSEAQEAS